MKTLTELIYLYGDLFEKDMNPKELGGLICETEGVNDEFFEGVVQLGVCPVKEKKPGVNPVKCWKLGVIRERKILERIRLNNNTVALGKTEKVKIGKKRYKMRSDRVEPFPCDAHPYTLDRLKTAIRAGEILSQANAAKNGGNQTYSEK